MKWNLPQSSEATRLPEVAIMKTSSENTFLVPQISKRPDVRDDKGHPYLIIRTHLPQGQPSIFQGDATTLPVVAHLRKLVLQSARSDVITHPGGDVESAARFAAVTQQHAHLVRKWLQDGIGLQPEMRDGGEKFLVRLVLR